MALARSRLLRELREANKLEDPNIRLKLCNNNILNWTAYIRGPDNSPYEGGIFKLNITCPPDYPMNPPTVTFETKIFHPNINFQTGEVCMDVLKSNWSPAWTLAYLCRGIVYILGDPNADSPLNCDAGNLLRSGDTLGFERVSKMMLQYNFSNHIYVRNISPDVTEQTIRNFFGACDEIVSIEFKKFKQSDRRYCKIEFKTSAGITKASHMNGSLLLGCPLEITVTDPTLLMQDGVAGQNGVLVQQQQLQQQVDTEEIQKSRCVKISNLPHKYDRIDVYTLLGGIGTIVTCRLETSQGTKSATVEFKSCFEANEALKMSGVAVGTNVLKVVKVVPPRQSNVQLQIASAAAASIPTSTSSRNDLDLPTQPARSAVFNEKLAKVLEMRERIHRKLANRTEASAPGVAKPRAAADDHDNGSDGWWSRHKSESHQRRRRRSKSTSLSSSSKSIKHNNVDKSSRDKQENDKGDDDHDDNKSSSKPSGSREHSRGRLQRSLSAASDESRGKSHRHRRRHEKHHRHGHGSSSGSRRHHHQHRHHHRSHHHRHRNRRDSSSPSRSRSRCRSFASRHSKSSRR